jgi:S1-C subfamily serine protease
MRLALASLIAACAALAAGCGGSGTHHSSATTGSTPQLRVVEVGQSSQFNAPAIYSRDAPGVVTVISVFRGGAAAPLFGGGTAAQGSGFVINTGGEVVTNAHVVTNGNASNLHRASSVYVKFTDGNEVPASIVGADPNADVALLRISPSGLNLKPLSLGSSSHLTVGAPVAALGTPVGEQGTMTVGIISATHRSIQSLNQSSTQGSFAITGAIQTDAAINHGNSGGPLVDANGSVIGINSQIAPSDSSGASSGIGFAVPVDAVKHSVDQLRAHGSVAYAYIGVSSLPLFLQLAKRLGLPVNQGSLIDAVTAGGPAEKAGLRGGSGKIRFDAQQYPTGGDVITKVNGHPLSQSFDLADAIVGLSPGQTVRLEVWRGGSRRNVKVTLGTRPNSGGG